MSINRTQSILDKLQIAIPVALLNSDGSPLHPPIDHTQNRNIYAISTKDGEDILSMQESSKPLKILEKENLEKIIKDFPRMLYAPKRTDAEIIEDAEDSDLGIPPKDRSLSEEEKKKRLEDEIMGMKQFHLFARSSIYKANPTELRNIRTNLTLAVATYALIEEYLEQNPEIDPTYFRTAMELTIQSRMLVIDAMTARGIQQ